MAEVVKIGGLWSGHDCSFCVLENGIPTIHAELERYNREKETKGDSGKFFLDILGNAEGIEEFATCYPRFLVQDTTSNILEGRKLHVFGHHRAHAAHAFYSSKADEAIVFTFDGGGVEAESSQGRTESATTVWHGKDTKLNPVKIWPSHHINIGGLWTRVTRYIFRLQNGWPRGHQAGSVMAMAALGDRERFFEDFMRMLTVDIMPASMKPKDQPVGAYTGNDPRHPYLGKYTDLADSDLQTKYDLAASLQAATEHLIFSIVGQVMKIFPNVKNVCIAGGVALNSVAMGKMIHALPDLETVYIPPVPYDGGLSIGAAQYLYHHVKGYPRVKWDDNVSPYLGEKYSGDDIEKSLSEFSSKVKRTSASADNVVDLLMDQKIVAIFAGRSESGRRALGNRSILADPRSDKMKDLINQKVKHRQWYRPFAPSILREEVKNWFVDDIESPFMSHVIHFKEEAKEKVPAVVHLDGTARLQTVTKQSNPTYYDLISRFFDKTGVPILLNTSFNDREPICENIEHAVSCFLRTDIDYLWLADLEVLLEKK